MPEDYFGERVADRYDESAADMFDPGVVAPVVDFLVELARDGATLELGIGTGRIALPLAERGLEVHGIDASPAMVARLRAKPGGDAIPVRLGDFADVGVAVDGGFGVVLVAFNTLFNLSTAEAQRRCFANVASRLRPGGAFVVEAYVPGVPGPDQPVEAVVPTVIEPDRVVLQATQEDRGAQTVTGSSITIDPSGIRLRPWLIRYARPEELDGMASAAGLSLAHRWSGWRGEPFSADAPRHVSTYRRR